MLLALDPGPCDTAYVMLELDQPTAARFRIAAKGFVPNVQVLDDVIPSLIPAVDAMRMLPHSSADLGASDVAGGGVHVVSEAIQAMGMSVGSETFDTCIWIGRFMQRALMCGATFDRIKRTEIKLHLCGTPRAKDTNVRQALIDRFGPGRAAAVGTKKAPGPLHGIAGHRWSALAVAVTWLDHNSARDWHMAGQVTVQEAREVAK